MTMMSGTPDWYHPSQPLPAPLVNVNFHLTVNGGERFGPFFVAPYQTLLLDSAANEVGNHLQMVVTFWADQAATINLRGFTYEWPQSHRLFDVIPVLGAWVTIDMSEIAWVNFNHYRLTVTPYVPPLDRRLLVGGTEMAVVINQAIAAGATFAQRFSVTFRGGVDLFVRSSGKNWRAEVWFVSTGDVTDYYLAGCSSGAGDFDGGCHFTAKGNGMELRITNDDAAAQAFYAEAIAAS